MPYRKAIRIENWSVLLDATEEYASPDRPFLKFSGVVYGHPNIEDGEPIHTSAVMSYTKGMFRTASGAQYILGEINPEYAKEYPNAYSRLVQTAERYLQEEE